MLGIVVYFFDICILLNIINLIRLNLFVFEKFVRHWSKKTLLKHLFELKLKSK